MSEAGRDRRRGVKITAVAGLLIVVGVTWWMRSGMSPVTAARLDAAEASWREAAIHHYDMRVETSGAQQGRYELEVRDGLLKSIERDGVPGTPADGAYWTVDGLFRTLRRELQMAEEGAANTILLAEFDRERGFPRAFLRQVSGATRSVSVEVTLFRRR